MTATITPNLQIFLEDLKSADLVGISLLPKNLGLRLDFTFGPEFGDVAVELYRLVHFVFSQSIDTDDEDLCCLLGFKSDRSSSNESAIASPENVYVLTPTAPEILKPLEALLPLIMRRFAPVL